MMISAKQQPADKHKGFLVGTDDYMTKPIESKKLEEMLEKYLPPELIEHVEIPEDDGEIKSLDENGEIDEDDDSAVSEKFAALKGVDIEEALKYTGGAEILEETLKEFYKNIDKNSAKIQEFVEEGDYRNYTILVHALKSSARLIGAAKLSDDAKYLEKCGDDENETEILEKTPALTKIT